MPSSLSNPYRFALRALGVAAFCVPVLACNETFEPNSPNVLHIIRGSGQTAAAGAALPDSVVVRVADAAGRPLQGVSVDWRLHGSEGSLSLERSMTGADGLAYVAWTLGGTRGRQTGEAAVQGVDPIEFWAVATAGSIAVLSVVPDSVVLPAVGDTVHIDTRAADAHGNEIVWFFVEWSSLDTSVADVDDNGVVTARGKGTARIVATLDGVADTAKVVVRDAPEAPVVSSVSADTLRPSMTVVLTGERFGDDLAQTVVTVDGVEVTVERVTPTSISVAMPGPREFACELARTVALTVRVGAHRTTTWYPLSVAKPRRLAPGEHALLIDPDDVRCNELRLDGGEYLLSVFNARPVSVGLDAVRLSGRTAHPGTTASAARAHTPGRGLATPSARPATSRSNAMDADPWSSPERHLDLLEQSVRLLNETAPSSIPGRRDAGVAEANAARLPASTGGPESAELGDTVRLHVPAVHYGNGCVYAWSIDARVVHVGERSMILEDLGAPLAGTMDAQYHELGREFDELIFPLLRRHFGDPLAFNAYLDGSGRVRMLFTPVVNEIGGIAGFVWGGDFLDREVCPASNRMEIFYGVAPTANAADPNSLDGWLSGIRALIIHETKHITSFAERFARTGGRVFEELWLEEATAVIAMELYGRELYGYRQNAATDYAAGLLCEVRPGIAGCEASPRVMLDAFAWLYNYLQQMPRRTPFGRVVGGDGTFYGSAWSLLRWTIDHLGGSSEAAFLRALTQEPERTGVANLEARTGRGIDEILGLWSLAIAAGAIHVPSGVVPEPLSIPSWDIRDVFSGLHRDLPEYFVSDPPGAVVSLEAGDFDVDIGYLHGGAASLFALRTGQATQLLHLSRPGLLPAAESIGLAIVRIQ